jgi:hypothetical protein
MTGRSNSSAASPLQRPIPPQAIVAVALLLAVVIGWMAYRTFGPLSQPKTFTVQDQKTWVAELARKSGGDFTRLTPAEQQKLDGISLGNGAKMLQSAYAKQK